MFQIFLTPQGSINLRTRLSLAFLFVSILVAGIAAFAVFFVVQGQITRQLQRRALSLVAMTALQQDANLHFTLTRPSDEGNSIFRAMRAKNEALMRTDTDIASIYTMRQDEQGDIYFVVDSVNQELSALRGPASLGEVYGDAGPLLEKSFASMTGPIVEDAPYTDSWGTWLSAYAPFYRADGTLEGVVGLDLSAQALTDARNQTLSSMLIVILLLLPVFALIGWFVGGRLSQPIARLTEGALRITSGDFSYRAPLESNDEVGQLTSAFNDMARRVDDLVSGLEQRVTERTALLEEQTQALNRLSEDQKRRATELQTVAQIGRAITSVQNLQELLPRITRLVSAQFGFYHVGIFLLAPDGKSAVLSAANSEGGKKLLESGFRLKVNESSMVGFTASTGNPRLTSDAEIARVFLKTEELAKTRSEITLPLKIGAQVIGVLDVQSEEPNTFDESDVEILGILADQVSVALQNARLFEETRKSLNEAEETYRKFIRREWQRMSARSQNVGYRYAITGPQPLTEPIETETSALAVSTGETQLDSRHPGHLAIPLKLRGEVIGVLQVATNTQRALLRDEKDIAQAVAERVSLALENARLVEDSQSRAALESTLGAIAAEMSASVNMKNILQTAVEALGRSMPGAEVSVQLRSDAQPSRSAGGAE